MDKLIMIAPWWFGSGFIAGLLVLWCQKNGWLEKTKDPAYRLLFLIFIGGLVSAAAMTLSLIVFLYLSRSRGGY